MKRVREIVVSNVEIEDKFSWWFNTNDSQLYHFTLGKWSTLFGTATPSQDGLMSKEDKEVLISLSMGSSVVTVPTYADLEAYEVKSEAILYVVKATNKIYRFYNNNPVEINTFYFNSLEDVKNLQGIGVYHVVVGQETYILYISQVGSQLTYILHSPKKYIECSYNTSNSEWSEWVTTNYDAAGAILDIQNWVTAQVAQQNATLSSMQAQITTIANSSTSNFNILHSSLNSLSSEVATVKNNITTINGKISQINNTINSLTQANNNFNTRIGNLENNYASKTWVNNNFATINNLNIARNQISANYQLILGLTSRVVTLEEAMATLQDIPSSYLLKSEAELTYATIGALSSLELQTLNNSDQINLHSILISNLQNNTITQTDLDIINQRIAGLVTHINSLYEISATKTALTILEQRVNEMDNKISAVFRYKGSVPTYDDLIALTEMVIGDVYNVTETGDNYAWTDTEWDKLAGEIDLTAYLTKDEALNTYETITNVQTLNNTVSGHIESNLHLTEGQRTKLEGIEAGAEVNVNADWNATTGDAQILNKPNTLSGYGITDVPSDDKTYGRKNGGWSEIVNSGGGDIEHDATSDKNGNSLFLHVTADEKQNYSTKSYATERVNAVGESIALKLDTKTIISNTLTNSDSLTITLPTPRLNFVNESILTIRIGSTVPNITLPAITGWYTDVVALAPMTTRTIVFEQITFDGINYEVWASCDKQ